MKFSASLTPTQALRIVPGSLPYSLCLCHGSLATLVPAKVAGLASRRKWSTHWPTDLWGDGGFTRSDRWRRRRE